MAIPENPFSFNYIITIHNKQDLIADVMLNVIRCMGPKSKLYPVLDGCTDNSEKIIDEIAKKYSDYPIIKVFEKDVHELKSINAGLRAAYQQGNIINVVLQDDVMLIDHDIEEKLSKLYSTRPNLGIISLRHGGNLSRGYLKKKEILMPVKDYVESIKGHNPSPFNSLQLGKFAYREIAIKSPICIPGYVVRKVGLPDERFAPWDDIAYCYTVSKAGFDNGVYAVDFASDLSWGTTRQKKQNNDIGAVHKKNLTLFKELYLEEALAEKKRGVYGHKTYSIFELADPPRLTFKQKITGTRVYMDRMVKYYLKLMLKK